MMRMPSIVSDTHSPWVGYLSAVYRSKTLPLPVDLRPFEAFYPALLPVAPCTKTSHLEIAEERRWQRAWSTVEAVPAVAQPTGTSAPAAAAGSVRPPPSPVLSAVKLYARRGFRIRHPATPMWSLSPRRARTCASRLGIAQTRALLAASLSYSRRRRANREDSRWALVASTSNPLHGDAGAAHVWIEIMRGIPWRGIPRIRLLGPSGGRLGCLCSRRPAPSPELAQPHGRAADGVCMVREGTGGLPGRR